MFRLARESESLILRSVTARTLVIAVVLLLNACAHRSPGEATYRGRTVSQWLNETAEVDYDRRIKANGALKRIGTNGVPVYLSLLSTNAPRGEAQSLAWAAGLVGFQLLHTNAAPFIPELWRLATNGSYRAVTAFGAIGAPAIPALLEAFKSPQWEIRRDALAATVLFKVRGDEDSLKVLMNPVLQTLNDPVPDVRFNAARVVTSISTNAQLLAPALQRLTSDPHARVRSEAIGSLAKLGTNASPAFDGIASRISDEDENVRKAVTNALYRIDGRRARDFGVRAPHH